MVFYIENINVLKIREVYIYSGLDFNGQKPISLKLKTMEVKCSCKCWATHEKKRKERFRERKKMVLGFEYLARRLKGQILFVLAQI